MLMLIFSGCSTAEPEYVFFKTEIREQLEEARISLEIAFREGDLENAGELQYSLIPSLEHKLSVTEKKEKHSMVQEIVTDDMVASVVSRWAGIPINKIMEGERSKLLSMEEHIERRVIGQGEAVTVVSNAVRRARAGLQDISKPIGSFLFVGPTGVGKTELTKALAEFLFNDESALLRMDMSEYMEKHSVARLIGAPPGYVGYEESGFLTEAIRRRPFQVILFDEIEKAHSDVFNILLQVLDDGRAEGHAAAAGHGHVRARRLERDAVPRAGVRLSSEVFTWPGRGERASNERRPRPGTLLALHTKYYHK